MACNTLRSLKPGKRMIEACQDEDGSSSDSSYIRKHSGARQSMVNRNEDLIIPNGVSTSCRSFIEELFESVSVGMTDADRTMP